MPRHVLSPIVQVFLQIEAVATLQQHPHVMGNYPISQPWTREHLGPPPPPAEPLTRLQAPDGAGGVDGRGADQVQVHLVPVK